jgi:succinate dehydrogenase/fumarate reductase flavoprotein subunit
MERYDFTFVGNGASGTFAAIELKQNFSEMLVALIRKANHAGYASVAARVKIAVYVAMEECSPEQTVTHVTCNLT